jgi:hypothetical protein
MVDLAPATHQYKFIVDGQWRHDHTAPTVLDNLGNVNNCTLVNAPPPLAPGTSANAGASASGGGGGGGVSADVGGRGGGGGLGSCWKERQLAQPQPLLPALLPFLESGRRQCLPRRPCGDGIHSSTRL